MSSRLHTTLVYFGVTRDPGLEARLAETPVTGWRAAAVAGAVVLVAAVAIGVLVLLGSSGVSPLLIGLFVAFEVVVVAWIVIGRRDRT